MHSKRGYSLLKFYLGIGRLWNQLFSVHWQYEWQGLKRYILFGSATRQPTAHYELTALLDLTPHPSEQAIARTLPWAASASVLMSGAGGLSLLAQAQLPAPKINWEQAASAASDKPDPASHENVLVDNAGNCSMWLFPGRGVITQCDGAPAETVAALPPVVSTSKTKARSGPHVSSVGRPHTAVLDKMPETAANESNPDSNQPVSDDNTPMVVTFERDESTHDAHIEVATQAATQAPAADQTIPRLQIADSTSDAQINIETKPIQAHEISVVTPHDVRVKAIAPKPKILATKAHPTAQLNRTKLIASQLAQLSAGRSAQEAIYTQSSRLVHNESQQRHVSLLDGLQPNAAPSSDGIGQVTPEQVTVRPFTGQTIASGVSEPVMTPAQTKENKSADLNAQSVQVASLQPVSVVGVAQRTAQNKSRFEQTGSNITTGDAPVVWPHNPASSVVKHLVAVMHRIFH